MGKIISTMWQTLDGVIAAESMPQWFAPYDSESRRSYIQDTIRDCEAMLFGRHTYEMLSGYWSQQQDNAFGVADKLNNTRKYLISTTAKEAAWGETIILDKEVSAQIRAVKHATHGNILVQGSASLVDFLLREELIDELRLLIHPHICGTGKRLFSNQLDVPLVLAEQRTLDNGVVLLTYRTSNPRG